MQDVYKNRVGTGAIWAFVDTEFQTSSASGTNISGCEQTLFKCQGKRHLLIGRIWLFGSTFVWIFDCSVIPSVRKCSGATSSLALRGSSLTVLPHGARD